MKKKAPLNEAPGLAPSHKAEPQSILVSSCASPLKIQSFLFIQKLIQRLQNKIDLNNIFIFDLIFM